MQMRPGSFSSSPGAPPPPAEGRWRVAPLLVGAKLALTVVFALVGLALMADRRAMIVAFLGAAVAGGFALRDLIAPVRLAADPAGVTVVSGFAGHRWVPWSAVERVRVDSRSRAGLRSELLEIDTGDTLHLFSHFDLNARPDVVLEALRGIRGVETTA